MSPGAAATKSGFIFLPESARKREKNNVKRKGPFIKN